MSLITKLEEVPETFRQTAAKYPVDSKVWADDSHPDMRDIGSYRGPATVTGYSFNLFGRLLIVTDKGSFYVYEIVMREEQTK